MWRKKIKVNFYCNYFWWGLRVEGGKMEASCSRKEKWKSRTLQIPSLCTLRYVIFAKLPEETVNFEVYLVWYSYICKIAYDWEYQKNS